MEDIIIKDVEKLIQIKDPTWCGVLRQCKKMIKGRELLRYLLNKWIRDLSKELRNAFHKVSSRSITFPPHLCLRLIRKISVE